MSQNISNNSNTIAHQEATASNVSDAQINQVPVVSIDCNISGANKENVGAVINNSNPEHEDRKMDETLVYPLLEIFPDACPQFIRNLCHGKQSGPGVLDDLITHILDFDYPRRTFVASPKRIISAEQQLEIMKQILPDADPNYLRIHCERLFDKPEELKAFIDRLLKTCQYPTMKDYLRQEQLSAQQKQYTTDFSVQKFLEVIPNPIEYFNDKNRKAAKVDSDGFDYAFSFLRNHYSKIQLNRIRDAFNTNNLNFLLTCSTLDKLNPATHMKGKRVAIRMPKAIKDIPLLQEIAFIKHQKEILQYIEEHQINEKIERSNLKTNGLLQACSCCYDEEVMPKDIFKCEFDCMFCRECVKKGAEVTYGNGKLDFLCLNNCPSNFSLQTLQAVLNPKMFSVIALKKQVEEVKSAGIEELEVCPYCDFATIPAREDKLFRCLNPECMKESCRSCKEPSHVPFRCDEIEKASDVKNRIFVENKMTEALLRKCYKCGLKFIKADGCNKMTCSCGALMCYICCKPVQDYKHFNGLGGDRFDLCPLYSDTNKLHEDAVLEGAMRAKQEIGIDNVKLKYDPTIDVKEHYKEQAKNYSAPPMPQQANNFFAQMQQIEQHEINVFPGMLPEYVIQPRQLVVPNIRPLQRYGPFNNPYH